MVYVMPFSDYLVLCAMGIVLDGLALTFKKGFFALLGFFWLIIIEVSAYQGSEFIDQTFYNGTSVSYNYAPLYPDIMFGLFLMLITGVLLIKERKHFA